MDQLSSPSFTDQLSVLGGWSGFWLDSEKSGFFYSNSGVTSWRQGFCVARRLTQLNSGSFAKNWRENRSYIDVFDLDTSSMVLTKKISLNEELGDFFVNIEDPRLVESPKGFEIWCVKWVADNVSTSVRQCVISLNQMYEVCDIDFPDFGGNDGTTYEKNWGPCDNGRYFVYKNDPHHVVVHRATGRSWSTPGLTVSYPDVMHGGTPPLDLGDRYLCLCQSSSATNTHRIRDIEAGMRWYKVWAYTFEKYPPFSILECTTRPLLYGSLRNPISEGSFANVFPGGISLLPDGKLLLVAGINECKTAWAVLDVASIANQLSPF